jgi:hypothetical protein
MKILRTEKAPSSCRRCRRQMEELKVKKRLEELQQAPPLSILDPEAPSFERQGNAIYEVSTNQDPHPPPATGYPRSPGPRPHCLLSVSHPPPHAVLCVQVGKGSIVYPDPVQYPEVKEYMRWRLKRNKKRFQRLDRASRSIQGAFRGHLARKVVKNIRINR